ncbi:MAG: hypothetical protein IPM96_05665 [Ignavibacteria bacterium]|nr:hypothetical protein [Ignavibacteria bacterium]
MSKQNKTIDFLMENISEDWIWRLKELNGFKSTLEKTNDKLTKSCLIRAGITILYAHWEGFVKECSYNYYNYVTTKGFKLSELSECFVAISMRKELNELIDSRKVVTQSKAISILFREFEKRGKFPDEIPLRTSNLTFEIFEEYCTLIGIDILQYETKRQFINRRLVDNRNKIAHGKFLMIDEIDFKEIFELTISLMKSFKVSIENSAYSSSFKKVA